MTIGIEPWLQKLGISNDCFYNNVGGPCIAELAASQTECDLCLGNGLLKKTSSYLPF